MGNTERTTDFTEKIICNFVPKLYSLVLKI